MTIILAIDADPPVCAGVCTWLERRGVNALVVDGGAGNEHVATFAVDPAIRLLLVQTLQRKQLDGGDRDEPGRAAARGQA